MSPMDLLIFLEKIKRMEERDRTREKKNKARVLQISRDILKDLSQDVECTIEATTIDQMNALIKSITRKVIELETTSMKLE